MFSNKAAVSPKPKILVCPLDWGLGHATRCIPIIRELISNNCEVIIAADKLTFSLLNKEFPDLSFLRIKGYEIKYSRTKGGLAMKLLGQMPKMVLRIRSENKWLKKVIKAHGIDAVISDNRLGLYSSEIPCVYITHQLAILTGTKWGDFFAKKVHGYFIKKYTACWIPDFEKNGLAGKLSHPDKLPENASYIGALSRFEMLPNLPNVYHLLVLISGPEPQRSIFEKLMVDSLIHFDKKVLIVRGLPSSTEELSIDNEKVLMKNHLDAHQLNIALQQSEMVISRSGYTTIMDLLKLKKKAILVPTPGQTEQEYLAHFLAEKGYFYSVSQQNFNLKEALRNASIASFAQSEISCEEYKKVLSSFVLSLKSVNFAAQ